MSKRDWNEIQEHFIVYGRTIIKTKIMQWHSLIMLLVMQVTNLPPKKEGSGNIIYKSYSLLILSSMRLNTMTIIDWKWTCASRE